VGKDLVRIADVIERKAMSNKKLGIDLVRMQAVEKHWRTDNIDQACGDCDVSIPEVFQMKMDLDSMHPDVGNDATRRDNFRAEFECRSF
jgi:hypothetical protein